MLQVRHYIAVKVTQIIPIFVTAYVIRQTVFKILTQTLLLHTYYMDDLLTLPADVLTYIFVKYKTIDTLKIDNILN